MNLMKIALTYSSAWSLLLLLGSCQSETPPTTAIATTAPVTTTIDTEAFVAPPPTILLDTATIDTALPVQKVERPSRLPAQLTFNTLYYNYDTITMGDVIKHDFNFTNTGERPLSISNVQGSCGCTIASYPFVDIAPQEQGKIQSKFDSKGKLGNQRTTVTVYSNAEPKQQVLVLEGYVLPKSE